jgi:holo-[acyl-carrier protein] synthase
MIIGIGTDITEVSRIGELLEKSGRFKERTFTAAEQQKCDRHKESTASYAGRWAAKEACAQALGCGIGAECALTDVEILNDAENAPYLLLHGAAEKRAEQLGVKHIYVSISHEKEYAVAFVILEN